MTPRTRSLRNGAVTAAATAALLALTGTAALARGGEPAEVDVTHDCTSIDVTSSQSISNVVLAFADGDTQRFEGLPESRTGTFAGTGDDSGEVITTAWVKSGDNKSGDGPGYGERFDFDTSACDDDATSGNDDGQTGDQQAAGVQDRSEGSDAGGSSTTGDDTADDVNADLTTAGTSDQGSDEAADETGEGGDENGDASDAGADRSDVADDAVEDQSDVADASAGTTDQDAASAGAETPATTVLGAVEQREAGTDLRSADAGDVRRAGTLPNTGGDPTLPLAAALAALALGAGLLRRTSRSSA